jgi:hypothetical protein
MLKTLLDCSSCLLLILIAFLPAADCVVECGMIQKNFLSQATLQKAWAHKRLVCVELKQESSCVGDMMAGGTTTFQSIRCLPQLQSVHTKQLSLLVELQIMYIPR